MNVWKYFCLILILDWEFLRTGLWLEIILFRILNVFLLLFESLLSCFQSIVGKSKSVMFLYPLCVTCLLLLLKAGGIISLPRFPEISQWVTCYESVYICLPWHLVGFLNLETKTLNSWIILMISFVLLFLFLQFSYLFLLFPISVFSALLPEVLSSTLSFNPSFRVFVLLVFFYQAFFFFLKI